MIKDVLGIRGSCIGRQKFPGRSSTQVKSRPAGAEMFGDGERKRVWDAHLGSERVPDRCKRAPLKTKRVFRDSN